MDDAAELSGVSERHTRRLFYTFCEGIQINLFPEVVVNTLITRNLARNVYSKLGLSPVFCSMDVTHVPWLACPVELSAACTGKEGYPTLAWQVTIVMLENNNSYIIYIHYNIVRRWPLVQCGELRQFCIRRNTWWELCAHGPILW
jgi:hypothetical protein